MSETIVELLLSDSQQAHFRVISGAEISNLQKAFLTWLLPIRFADSRQDNSIRAACAKRGGALSYRDVAVVGYSSSRISDLSLSAERDALVDWIQGTNIRSSIGYDPIVDDPIGAVGVMLAIDAASDAVAENGRKWLASLCAEAATENTKSDHVSAFRALSNALSGMNALTVSADVSVAFQSKGILPVDPSVYAEAFERAKSPGSDDDIFTAGVRLAALDWIESQTALHVQSPTVSYVVGVLNGAQSSLYRWVWEQKPKTSKRTAQPRKWNIDNEYHFQSFLYAILRPIFPDLKEEEYTASVGTTQPRADLYIPSLKLVIEVKFWYRKRNSRDLLNELAADASLYRAKRSEVQRVIPVVWDEGRRTEEHSVIQDGIRALDGLDSAIFVNRPSSWADD